MNTRYDQAILILNHHTHVPKNMFLDKCPIPNYYEIMLKYQKEYVFIVLLLLISIASLIDMFFDYSKHASMGHLVIEFGLILLSLGGVVYLIFEIFKHKRKNQTLEVQLADTQKNLSETQSRVKKAGQQYRQVIREQLEEWQLSESEREVAMLLLKGLSFKEIAEVRETQEKTVRQQASSLYKKAELAGRHEFSAYFFEDLL